MMCGTTACEVEEEKNANHALTGNMGNAVEWKKETSSLSSHLRLTIRFSLDNQSRMREREGGKERFAKFLL